MAGIKGVQLQSSHFCPKVLCFCFLCSLFGAYGGLHHVDVRSNKQANVSFPSVVQFLFSSCIARKETLSDYQANFFQL